MSGPSSKAARQVRVVYWATTVVSAVAFAVPGAANLLHVDHFVQDMAHLGYPSYFMSLLGAWKLLGAATLLAPKLPRLKEWAYAGMIFDLTGAAASRAAMKDGFVMIVIPLLISVVVLVSWWARPEERKLKPN